MWPNLNFKQTTPIAVLGLGYGNAKREAGWQYRYLTTMPRFEIVVAQTREVMRDIWIWDVLKEEHAGFLDGPDMEWGGKNKMPRTALF